MAAVLAVVFAQAACSGDSGPASMAADSAGVTIVTNDPDQPVWDRDTAWRLAPAPKIQVGNVPGDPGHQLYGVEHSRRLRDGGILVANTGLGDVRVYDVNGTPMNTYPLPASLSEGPVQPMIVSTLPGDSILVALADGGLAIIRPDGFIGRRVPPVPAQDGGVMKLTPVGIFGDGALLMRGDLPYDTVQPGIRRHPIRLYRYDKSGGRPTPLGDFGAKAEMVGEGVLVWAPEGQFATADSTVWYGDSERFEVREVAPSGRTLRIFRLDLAPAEVTAADTAIFRRGALTQLQGNSTEDSARAVVEEYRYPATFPTFDRVVADALGNVWVRHFGWFDLGADKTWSIFASDGRYLGDLSTPAILEIHQIGPDWLLGRMATARGREAVYVWDIIKPGEAPGAQTSARPGS
jgi:hypothetical protein